MKVYSQNTQFVFKGKSLSYYDRAKSMTDLSGVGSVIGGDITGSGKGLKSVFLKLEHIPFHVSEK